MSNFLKVGDVFFANTTFEFAYADLGSYGHEKQYKKGESVLQVSDRGDTHERHMITTGFDPKTGHRLEVETHAHEKHSKQRVGKEFVVETVRNLAPSERDGIRSEPEVTARRLKADGSYDPNGELIKFVDCPAEQRSNYSTAATVKTHRKMKRTVNFV